MKVSVVIPNYNYGRFIGAAVESVLAQTYKCDEIIVVDDGSTDDSLEALSAFEKDGVKIVRQQNSGVGAARNNGVRASSGEIIAFLDADDRWLPEKIEKQVAAFEHSEDVGLVTCGMKEIDREGNFISNYLQDVGEDVCAGMLTFNVNVVVSGSAISVRRNFFEQAGGFDERKELHPSEDWEFFYRMAGTSKIIYVPELLVHYLNHGGNGHLKIERMERSMTLALEKVFKSARPEIQKYKRMSYGNMHFMLCGSYNAAGNQKKALAQGLKSAFYNPANSTKLLAKVFSKLTGK